jgi:uncharacterized protein
LCLERRERHGYNYDEKKLPEDDCEKIFRTEYNYRKVNENSNFKKNIIKSIQINNINTCNLSCKYCFADLHNKKVMDIKTAIKSIDFLFNNSNGADEVSITIIGGEPLLNINVFKKIVEYSRYKSKVYNRKLNIMTTTNGTLLKEETKNYLKENDINVMVSLDSNKKIYMII